MTSPGGSVRTRIEPSPSGSLHVGNAMTASFNWYWARKHGGAFVLRIADTDAARVTPEGIRSAMEDLRWLGLQWDEGPELGGPHEPYFQSQRFDLYREAAGRLRDSGAAYRCYCSAEELDERRRAALAAGRPPLYDRRCRELTAEQRRAFEDQGRTPVLRFAMPEGTTTVHDVVRGDTTFDNDAIGDFVIMRADGTPLYNLAVTYDDVSMEITHVIRGDDIFANTPKQVQLMSALGHEQVPVYAHVPLIVGADRAPLSKRHGDTAVSAYRDMGVLPEVLLNYLATLDWSVGDGSTERFTIDQLIESFDLAGVTRNPSAFDVQKLLSWNGDTIRTLSVDELVDRLVPFLIRDGVLDEPITHEQHDLLVKIAPHVQERMKRLDETSEQLRFLFVDEVAYDERAQTLLRPERADLLEQIVKILSDVEWRVDAINAALMEWADNTGLKRKDALQPVRAAMTGSVISPPLFESIEALGRERAVARARRALEVARG